MATKSFDAIIRLGKPHVKMDSVIAPTYGWQVVNLGHSFHETVQGIRFTISEEVRREVLARLLKLNHERWEEEQRTREEGGSMKDEKRKGKKRNVKAESGSGKKRA